MQRSPQQNVQGSGASPRSTQVAKTIHFYKDGDYYFSPVSMAISPKKYRSMDTLLSDLSVKVPGLSFGVRSIYTPKGRHSVKDVSDMQNEGRYVCSTHRNYAKGIKVEVVHPPRAWHGGKPPSGKNAYNSHLLGRNIRKKKVANTSRTESRLLTTTTVPKKITVMKNGFPHERHVIMLNRRTAQTFEQVLDDMSDLFRIAVRRLFTTDGKLVTSLSAIFHGPDVYVAAKAEPFKTMITPEIEAGISPRPPQRKRRSIVTGDSEQSKVREKKEKISKSHGKWKVWVTTNELPTAGTTAQVYITVYGQRGNSGAIPLGLPDGSAFQSEHKDEFEISVGNIGEIYKIRLHHDNAGEFPGWFCDQVQMHDMHTEEDLVFTCGRWLSRKEDDCEITRELPAVRENKPTLPVFKYSVQVFTGDVYNAGTEANVYMTIYGERGDTGVRQLIKHNRTDFQYEKGKDDEKLFTMDKNDSFTIEAVSLGALKKIIIGHDGVGHGQGWFLEKVIIKESPSAKEDYLFYCHRWLDEGEDDKKIVREIKVQEESPQFQIEKEMWEYEQWKYANDNKVVFINLLTQRALRLKPDGSVDGDGDFKDELGVFTVVAKKGSIRVFRSLENPKYHLAIDNGKVVGMGKGGAYCEFIIRPQRDRSIALESVKHTLQTVTIQKNGKAGDPRGSILDHTKMFFCYCKGMFRDTGEIMLSTSPFQTLAVENDNTLIATGKRNRLAHFKVHKVGTEGNVRKFESLALPGQFIQIKDGQADCKGTGDGHCEFRVVRYKEKGFITLESVSDRGVALGMTADGTVRPTVDTGERNVRFWPEVIKFGKRKKKEESPVEEPVEEPVKSHVREKTASPAKESAVLNININLGNRTPSPARETPREKTKTPKKESKKSAKSVASMSSKPESTVSEFTEGDWKIWISTLESLQHGYIVLMVYGNKGKSSPVILGASGLNEVFQKGNRDVFKANLEKNKIGEIYKIRIELVEDMSEEQVATWKVKEVKMQDIFSNETHLFRFDRYLSRAEDDGAVARELPVMKNGKEVLPVVKYQVSVHTGTEVDSDTKANVYIQLNGEHGDTGKRLLHRSNNKDRFLQGQVDVFELEAVSLGQLSTCEVSIDTDSPGDGWYCHQVVIKEGDKEFIYPCDQWLDAGKDDKKITRILKLKEDIKPEQTSVNATLETRNSPKPEKEEDIKEDKKEENKSRGVYGVLVTTAKDSKPSNDSKAVITVYGEEGVSEDFELWALGAPHKLFEAGNIDEFQINAGDIGDLYKIRVGMEEGKGWEAWHLEEVILQDKHTEESFIFHFDRWMSRDMDDHDVVREMAVQRDGKEVLPMQHYEVSVYTGRRWAADCDANLYITLCGSKGDSGKRQLYHSLENDCKFQREQVDVFKLEAVSLEDLTKVVVSHDGRGHGAGIFLDKVVVKETDGSDREVIFPCGHWLDDHEEDKKVEMELFPADDVQEVPYIEKETRAIKEMEPESSKGNWAAWITTGGSEDAGTTATLTMVVYGVQGKSDQIPLCKEEGEGFKPGMTDDFKISVGDIGNIYKVQLALQSSEMETFYLSKMKLKDQDTGQEFHFAYDNWLRMTAENPSGCVELPAVWPDIMPLQDVTYVVSVTTGHQPGAETRADVYCMLVGEWGDTGRRALTQTVASDTTTLNNVNFRKGQSDTFHISGLDLGKLEKVIVGHTTEGYGAGWFCESVTVRRKEETKEESQETEEEQDKVKDEGDSPPEYELIFPCHRWLDSEIGDGQLERELLPMSEVPLKGPSEELESKGEWKVKIVTVPQNGTPSAPVTLTVIGEENTAGPFELKDDSAEKQSEPDSQECHVSVGQIGDLKKIRVCQEQQDVTWFIKELTMEDTHTKEMLHFNFTKWLGDNTSSVKELPVARTGKWVAPVVPYTVSICTGDVQEGVDAGTFSNIFVNIIGTLGDSGKRMLSVNKNDSIKFQKGQVDEFLIEAVDLGDIQKVMVTKGPGDPWLFKEMIIREEGLAEEKVFIYDKWLGDTGNKDEAVDIELTESETRLCEAMQPTAKERGGIAEGEWTVQTLTGDLDEADNNKQLYVVMCGEKGETDQLPLQPVASEEFRQERGKWDKFKITVTGDIGPLKKIRLGYVDTSWDPSWYMDIIRFHKDTTSEEFGFEYRGWVRVDGECDGVVEFPVVWPGIPPAPLIKYQLSVYTGAVSGAGTDSNVYIIIDGQDGGTGKRWLKKSQNNDNKFEEGQMDIFNLESVWMKDLQKVVVGHDGAGVGSGWFLDKVVIKEDADAEKEYEFLCNKWLDEGEDDGKVERELLVTASEESGEEEAEDLESKELWKVWTTTGDLPDADASSQVVLILYGENDRSEEIPIGHDREEKFLKASTDEFRVKAKANLGKIYKLRVGFSEDTQGQPSWYLEKVRLQHLDSGANYEFEFNCWVSLTDEQDWWVERPVTEDLLLPVYKYEVTVHTGDKSGGGTNANVYLKITGERGDTGARRLLKSMNNINKFESGQSDTFSLEAVDLGQLKSVVVGHDGTGAGSGWFLDKVVIKDPQDHEYTFECDRWLDEGEDDGLIERELQLAAQASKWTALTFTGPDEENTTEAQVAMVLYGDKGHSKVLHVQKEGGFTITEGTPDEFELEVDDDLGDIYKLRVGFEDPSGDPQWFMKMVKFINATTSKEYIFELNGWIWANSEQDCWREIALRTEEEEKVFSVYKYQVEVYTGDKSGAGTNANVYLQVFGERGDTGKRKLLKSTNNSNKFEQGQLDLFEIEAVDMKDLTKVTVGHDGSGLGSGWYLDKIIITESPQAKKKYLFNCDRWLEEGEDDGLTERELMLTEVIDEGGEEPPAKAGDWKLTITTSPIENSGTDARVTVTVFGETGDTGPLPLGQPGLGHFESGKVDEFKIFVDPEKVGKITKLRLEHDNSSSAPGWHVGKIVLDNVLDETQLEFPVNRWLDALEEDGDTVRELPAHWPGEEPITATKYILQTHTSSDFGAGTDANVHVVLYGEKGDSGKRHLRKNIEGDGMFESGKVDTFHVEAIGLGKLTKVVIGHDGEGSGAGWYLEKVTIKEGEDGQECVFPCNRWLDSGEDDGKTERELILENNNAV
ncbi:lipoxygenase homology domain-containing protein 1 isoform X2 [Lingula anatina]|uniref:Lipoxygenase homology domain-containing protein 1 isoform X2 n=1 Tax=Lingula anatina TaxID=7574 RepID=A0A1S3IEF0_LINAN|nr:lipoxygenase homology domain-containing protein 1 isoform X2 [Lingula anatina]|eukprot:XP_013396607.1 lipoxygenase homology domain-containing protein 1 isoform X2 [Lingula anatina]